MRFLLPDAPVTSLDEYLAAGGGKGLERARTMAHADVIEELTRSGLRGRGGAGFPTGVKWGSVRRGEGRHRYVVCNAAEGEPATFKDRALLRANPYQMVEGLLIAAYAVEAVEAYIALKASFQREREALERAVQEVADAGWYDGRVHLASGPEEYLFGEEKALLEVIEGREPLPRWLPPYLHGLYANAPQLGWETITAGPGHSGRHEANPTVVNNVETLSNVPHILARGADWFRSMGTEKSPGTVCCTVVGDVAAPGVVEVEMGTPLSAVLDAFGGVSGGVKAVFSGVSNPVVVAEQLDTPLTYEDFEAIGSGLGAAGFLVYDQSTCMVEVAAMLSRFLYVESCGQCPPCKLGTGAITAALDRIVAGEGTYLDLDVIHERLRTVADGNRCYLGTEERRLVSSMLQAFPADFVAHLEDERCPGPRELPIPKIVDIADGKVTWDERQARKRPDWTYED